MTNEDSYKVYISGKITGDKNAEAKFKKTETQLTALGYEPVNPFEKAKSLKKQLHREPTYKEYIDFTLKLLMDCKAIYMLKDWSDSKGACLEYNYAKICGLEDITDEASQEIFKEFYEVEE